MEELATQKTSVITPIRAKGFDHFVVVKGVAQGRVILADQGFGNMTMKVDRFSAIVEERCHVCRSPARRKNDRLKEDHSRVAAASGR